MDNNQMFDTTIKRAEAAQKAAKELQVTWSARELVAWLKKWRASAGTRNLMRILMNAFGE